MVIMLDCKQVRAELSNYLDADVSAEVRAAVDDHLARCGCCKVIFDTLKKTLTIVGDTDIFAIPLEVSARLHAKLYEVCAGT